MKELVHFFGDSVLQSRTHSQLGSTNIFTGVTADWNVARSLYSIADIQSCIDKVRPVRFGKHLARFVNTYIFILPLCYHPLLTSFFLKKKYIKIIFIISIILSRIYMNLKLLHIVQVMSW